MGRVDRTASGGGSSTTSSSIGLVERIIFARHPELLLRAQHEVEVEEEEEEDAGGHVVAQQQQQQQHEEAEADADATAAVGDQDDNQNNTALVGHLRAQSAVLEQKELLSNQQQQPQRRRQPQRQQQQQEESTDACDDSPINITGQLRAQEVVLEQKELLVLLNQPRHYPPQQQQEEESNDDAIICPTTTTTTTSGGTSPGGGPAVVVEEEEERLLAKQVLRYAESSCSILPTTRPNPDEGLDDDNPTISPRRTKLDDALDTPPALRPSSQRLLSPQDSSSPPPPPPPATAPNSSDQQQQPGEVLPIISSSSSSQPAASPSTAAAAAATVVRRSNRGVVQPGAFPVAGPGTATTTDDDDAAVSPSSPRPPPPPPEPSSPPPPEEEEETAAVAVLAAELVPASEQDRIEELREEIRGQIRAELEREYLQRIPHASIIQGVVVGIGSSVFAATSHDDDNEDEDPPPLFAAAHEEDDHHHPETTSLHPPSRRKQIPPEKEQHRSTTLQELAKLRIRDDDIALQGRETELHQLKEICNHVLIRHQQQQGGGGAAAGEQPRRLVLVGGSTGVGKSRLVREAIRQQKHDDNCCFFGKYDFHQQGQPYTGIVAAYNSICENIVPRTTTTPSSTDDDDSRAEEALRSKLRELLSLDGSSASSVTNTGGGSSGGADDLLFTMIPALKHLLFDKNELSDEPQQSYDAADPAAVAPIDTAQHRLKFLFLGLTRILSEFLQGPLVLVLDDLMWADQPSLGLLSELAMDRDNNPHLLIVGTYRNNENYTNTETTFGSWLSREIDQASTLQMELNNLSVDGVQSLVTQILGDATISSSAASELAEIIYRKTLGNAFFVIQFLQNLNNQGLLTYNLNTMQWVWNGRRINELEVTDNVAGILRSKLEGLDPTSQFVAQVGSCLGASFSFILLLMGTRSLVDEEDPEKNRTSTNKVSKSLQTLLGEGIVARRAAASSDDNKEVSFVFSHDQIQQAAFDMIPPPKQQLWQALIGQAILRDSSLAETEQRLFLVTDLINKGISLDDDNPAVIRERKLVEKEKIVELNHRAGKKSMATSAYAAATSYLQTAISLLGESCWEPDERQRTLDLYSTVSESEFCNAEFDSMERYIETVVNRDELPIEFKMRPYLVLINSLNMRNQYTDAIDLGVKVLQMLHGKKVLPSKTSTPQIIYELLKTKKATSRKSFEELANLPLLDDEKQLYADRIIDCLVTATYTSGSNLFPLLPLRSVQTGIRQGLGVHSPPSFAAFAVILCGRLGELQEGYKMGRVAMAIQERLPHPRVCECRTHFIFYAMVAHWVVRADSLLDKFEEGFQIGMASGDLENAMLNKLCITAYHWHCGKPLSSLVQFASEAKAVMIRHQHEQTYGKLRPFWQFALNLMGQAKDPLVLTGQVMNEEKYLKGNGDIYSVTLVYGLRLQLAYLLGGDYSLLEELYKKTQDLPENMCSTAEHQRHLLYDGMVSFLLADKTKKRRKWLNRGKAAKKQVDKWVKEGDIYSTHVSFLLGAELFAVQGKHDKARQLYEQAIHAANKNGFPQDCALAYERSGINHLKMGNESRASIHFTKSHKAYLKWGATAKTDQLQQLYGDRIQN